jgi:hypothetical protein
MVRSEELRKTEKEVPLENQLQNLTAAAEESDRPISYDSRPTCEIWNIASWAVNKATHYEWFEVPSKKILEHSW